MGSVLSKMAEAVEDDVVQATMAESGLEGVSPLLRFPGFVSFRTEAEITQQRY